VKPDSTDLSAAIEALNAGEPIVVPTNTVYGLAVRAGRLEVRMVEGCEAAFGGNIGLE